MRDIDRHAIQACVVDAISLLHLYESARMHPQAPLLFQGLVAPFSMYVVESHNCVTTVDPRLRSWFEDVDVGLLRSSRHRAKLLDYKSISDVTQELLAIARQQQEFFNASHVGLLAPLKKALQGDLGFSICEGHLFWTTHETIYSFGDQDATGENALAFGEAFGRYIGGLLAIFAIHPEAVSGHLPALGEVEMRDIKYPALYGRGRLGRAGMDVGVGLVLILSAANLCRYVIQKVLPPGNLARLRLLFLTAFHCIAGMTAIQDGLLARRDGADAARLVLREALSHPDARWIRRHGHLRNLLTHYLVDARLEPLVEGLSTREAIVARLAGMPLVDLEALVERYLGHVSQTLESGFDLLGRDPFWYGKVS